MERLPGTQGRHHQPVLGDPHHLRREPLASEERARPGLPAAERGDEERLHQPLPLGALPGELLPGAQPLEHVRLLPDLGRVGRAQGGGAGEGGRQRVAALAHQQAGRLAQRLAPAVAERARLVLRRGGAALARDRRDERGAPLRAGGHLARQGLGRGIPPGGEERAQVAALELALAEIGPDGLELGDRLGELGPGGAGRVAREQLGERRAPAGVVRVERAGLAVGGERAGAVEAGPVEPPHRVVLQHPAQRALREGELRLRRDGAPRLGGRLLGEPELHQRQREVDPVERVPRVERDQAAHLGQRLGDAPGREQRRAGALEGDGRAGPADDLADAARQPVGVGRGEAPAARVEAEGGGDDAVGAERVLPREARRSERLARAGRQRPRPEAVRGADPVDRLPPVGHRQERLAPARRSDRARPLLAAVEAGQVLGQRLEDQIRRDRHLGRVVAGEDGRALPRLDLHAERRPQRLAPVHRPLPELPAPQHILRVALGHLLAPVGREPGAEGALARGQRAGELSRLDDAAGPHLGELELAQGAAGVRLGAALGRAHQVLHARPGQERQPALHRRRQLAGRRVRVGRVDPDGGVPSTRTTA